jgi:alginate O-acetyltransferase complex protein AlgI
MIGWVFFRSESLSQAIQYLGSMVGITNASGVKYYTLLYFDLKILVILIMGIAIATPIASWLGFQLKKRSNTSRFSALRPAIYAGHYVLLVSLFLFSAASLASGTYNPFIYYRF